MNMTKKTKAKAKAAKTRSDENVLGMYLEEINRIPLLSRDEEDLLAKAAAQGDIAARNRLITGNLRFVITVAKKYQGLGIPLADLINEGNIGLISAVERFDVSKGYHFISYAVWWIRQSILKALYEKARLIRLPVNQTNDLIHIERARKRLNGHSQNENQIHEIAQMLNIKEDYVADILAISREVVSLEKLLDSESGCFAIEGAVEDNRYDAPEQAAIQKFLANDIEELLENLDSKEAEVIRMHFGLGARPPMTLQEIGEQFHITKERVRQIEEKALMHLQKIGRKTKLEAYVA